MVKKIIQNQRCPRVEQVIFIDLETNDKIYEIDQTMPSILTFTSIDNSG